MGGRAEWRGPVTEVISYGRIPTVRQYAVVVSDIDDLVFEIGGWNPGVFMGHNPAALEAIKRENDHSEFLTTVFGVPGAPEWPVGQ
jgi:hypothetical protein